MRSLTTSPSFSPATVTPQMALGLAFRYIGTLPPKQQNLVIGAGLVGFGLYLLSKA